MKKEDFTRIALVPLLCVLSNFLTAQTAPVANPDTISGCIGDTIIINVLTNDSDADGDLLTLSAMESPEGGDFSFDTAGFVQWVPDDDDLDEITVLSYLLCDEDDDCSMGTLTIFVSEYGDCVWPGDANVDGIANQFDLLRIGLFYNDAGPDRFDADEFWDAEYGEDWDLGLFIGLLNPKFADCNGNGVINADDTTAIQSNYNFIHALKTTDATADGIPLTLDFSADTLLVGSIVTIPILLGSSTSPVTDIYGVGFSIEYDSAQVVPGSISVTFDTSWLGTPGTDLISMRHSVYNGLLDVSVTRTDKTVVSGNGTIGTVSFVMEDNLAGKSDEIIFTPFGICITPFYQAIDNMGDTITLTPGCDSAIVRSGFYDVTDHVRDGFLLFPNPTFEEVTASIADTLGTNELIVRNPFGGIVYRRILPENESVFNFSLQGIPAGIYLVTVVSSSGTHTRQLIISEK